MHRGSVDMRRTSAPVITVKILMNEVGERERSVTLREPPPRDQEPLPE
jgi:hypothetical protein